MLVTFALAWGSNYQGTNNTWVTGNAYSTSNQVNWMDSTSNNFYITGVQLEVGDTATDFEHLPHDVQLRRCHRYYQYLIKTISGSAKNFPIVQYQANFRALALSFLTEMRAAPTFTIDNYNSFSAFNGSDITVNTLMAYEDVSYDTATSYTLNGLRLDAEL